MEKSKRGSITRIFKFTAKSKAQQLVAADPRRRNLFIYNNGSAAVELLSAQNQKYGEGIPIAASGGTYTNRWSTAAFWVITESDDQELRVEVDGE